MSEANLRRMRAFFRNGASCFSCYPWDYAGGFYVPHIPHEYRRAGELADADAELQPQVDVVRRRVPALSLMNPREGQPIQEEP
jgi:hypothetical protein